MSIFDSNVNVYKVVKKECNKDFTKFYLPPEMGTGTMISYRIFEGIEIIFSDITMNTVIKSNFRFDSNFIEINYCMSGSVEARFNSRKIAYIADGDISLNGYNSNVDYCDFTKKPYKGIVIYIDVNKAYNKINQFTGLEEQEINNFVQNVVNAQTCIVTKANKCLDHIFKEFYILPHKYRISHMRIKVMELLLYLVSERDYEINSRNYIPVNIVDKINDAYNLLTEDVSKHITISEIAQNTGLNITNLKSNFKMIYGDTIYATLKKKRLQKARELILSTNYKIVEIASLVGYSNPSKFAKAYKHLYGSSPSDYRKSYKNKS